MSSPVADAVHSLAAGSPELTPDGLAGFESQGVPPAAVLELAEPVASTELAIDVTPTYDGPVPPAVQAAAAWSWRLMLIGAFGVILLWAIVRASLILIPVALAVMFSVLLRPARDWLAHRALLGRNAATGLCVVGSLLALIGLIYFAGRQLYAGFSDLTGQMIAAINTVQQWLAGPPLNITNDQFNLAWQQIQAQFATGDLVQTIIGGAMTAAGTFGNIVYGILICLFCTIFFLSDGRNIWNWIVNLLPVKARERVHQAGRRSMVTLSSYIRTVFVVAAIEGTLIGLGLAIFVPSLAIPVGVLSFISAFIPMLGAILTGLIATLLVLVARGLVPALIMLAIVLLVNQLESHVLQPILMGHAVSLHPVAVVIVVAVGLMIAGVAGALFAVPLAAVLNTFVQYLLGYDKFPGLGEDDHVPLLRKPKIEQSYQKIQESLRRVGRRREVTTDDIGDVFLTDLTQADFDSSSKPLRRKPKALGEHRHDASVSSRVRRLRKRGLIAEDASVFSANGVQVYPDDTAQAINVPDDTAQLVSVVEGVGNPTEVVVVMEDE